MTVLSNIITPSNVLTTTNTATVTNKTLTSPTVTGMVVSDGTANGVTYLNGSKVLTSGSALTYNGTSFGVGSSDYGSAGSINLSVGVPATTTGGLQLWSTTTGTHNIQFGDGTAGSASYRGYIEYAHTGDTMQFAVAATEGMRLTSTGLGIGTSSPAYKLDVAGTVKSAGTGYNGATSPSIILANTTASTGRTFILNSYNTGGFQIADETASGATRLDLDSAGNLGLGVTPSAWYSNNKVMQLGAASSILGRSDVNLTEVSSNQYVNASAVATYIATDYASKYRQYQGIHSWYTAASGTAGNAISFSTAMTLDASGNLMVGATTSNSAKLTIANAGAEVFQFYPGVASNENQTLHYNRSTSVYCTSSVYAADHRFYIQGAEKARIDSSGNLLVGTTNTNPGGSDINGIAIRPGNFTVISALGTTPFGINRGTDDGVLINLSQAGSTEGTISVSGTTVSYNGGHLSRWAQMLTKPELFKGTVMSNLDEMNVYTKDGQPVDNEQLNKVKVSDTEGDVNVAGVFVNWSHDDAHDVDEINMAMTGDMIIRIAQGVTVVRGDLLMSAGDGTAKPQGDDIIRSKTVAKVTSNHVTCTYADGSYCVPCVLMAC